MRFDRSCFFVGFCVILMCFTGGCRSGGRRYSPQETRLNHAAALALQEEFPASLRQVPLHSGLASVRKFTRTNMFVDWDALKFVGIKQDTPVTVEGVTTFETALLMMLGQASVGLPKGEVIGYEIIHGVIVISLSSVLDHGRFRPMHPRPDSQATYDAQVKCRQVIRMNFVKPAVVGVMLKHIESQTGVKMSVDWTSMEKVGAKRDMAYEMNVGAVPGDMALHLVLRRANRRLTGRDRLGYGIIDGVMHVSSGSSLSRMAEARAKKIQAMQKK